MIWAQRLKRVFNIDVSVCPKHVSTGSGFLFGISARLDFPNNQINPEVRDYLMARPLRLEFAAALYQFNSRVTRREPIFDGDEDNQKFHLMPDEVNNTYNGVCHAN
jgi:hypothetical protein